MQNKKKCWSLQLISPFITTVRRLNFYISYPLNHIKAWNYAWFACRFEWQMVAVTGGYLSNQASFSQPHLHQCTTYLLIFGLDRSKEWDTVKIKMIKMLHFLSRWHNPDSSPCIVVFQTFESTSRTAKHIKNVFYRRRRIPHNKLMWKIAAVPFNR